MFSVLANIPIGIGHIFRHRSFFGIANHQKSLAGFLSHPFYLKIAVLFLFFFSVAYAQEGSHGTATAMIWRPNRVVVASERRSIGFSGTLGILKEPKLVQWGNAFFAYAGYSDVLEILADIEKRRESTKQKIARFVESVKPRLIRNANAIIKRDGVEKFWKDHVDKPILGVFFFGRERGRVFTYARLFNPRKLIGGGLYIQVDSTDCPGANCPGDVFAYFSPMEAVDFPATTDYIAKSNATDLCCRVVSNAIVLDTLLYAPPIDLISVTADTVLWHRDKQKCEDIPKK